MALKSGSRLGAAAMAAIATSGGWLALTALGLDQVVGIRGLDWLWAPVVAGLALGALGLGRVASLVAAIGIAGLLVVGWVPAFGRLAQRYVRNDTLPADPADAIVVLAASVTSDERLSPAGVDRLLEGIRLLDAGRAPRMVVSRVWTETQPSMVSSDADQRELVAFHGREVELHVLDSVGSTRLEAERAKQLFDRQGWRTAIVVTSPVHTRRACAAFEGVGIAVTCRASPDRTLALAAQRSTTDRVRAFGQWVYETLGWWKYRLRGWVRSDS